MKRFYGILQNEDGTVDVYLKPEIQTYRTEDGGKGIRRHRRNPAGPGALGGTGRGHPAAVGRLVRGGGKNRHLRGWNL